MEPTAPPPTAPAAGYPSLGPPDLPAAERAVLARWGERDVFRRSVAQREGNRAYVFFEGPPTANGRPGAHHVLARSFKDLFPRYRTMRGNWVPRQAGWDCHGLPVELEVQRQLGIESKAEVEALGVAEFNRRCRESVLAYVDEWERFSDRMGFWTDHAGAYRTMDDSYIESVWWSLSELWKRDLLYRGDKVVPWCPRDETALSSHEVAQGYRDVVDTAVYVRFPVTTPGWEGTSLVAWTTTPYSLVATVGLAVGAGIAYVEAEAAGGERFLLAEARVAATLGDGARVVRQLRADELVGLHYAPAFDLVDPRDDQPDADPHRVVFGAHVTTDVGTGVVTTAPALGAEDMVVARETGLPVVNPVDARGRFDARVGPFAGLGVRDAVPQIVEALAAAGRLVRAEDYEHSYPHCWRCGHALVYWATSSWYVRTTAKRDELLAVNAKVDWRPPHIRDGRFGAWLENNVDWALSRQRFWGTPLPVWHCDDCGRDEAISSRSVLAERARPGVDVTAIELHRPYVDDVTLDCSAPGCEGVMTRYPEVIDVWYDSGAMPFASLRYPFAAPEVWQDRYPADFVCEAVDQTRGWFYSLLAVNTLTFREGPYRHVLCLGHLLDADGKKMSKSVGNTVDPWHIFDTRGADAFRLYLYSTQQVGPPYRFALDGVDEVVSKVLRTWWSTASFFCLYAGIDGWRPSGDDDPEPAERPALDRWLLAETAALCDDVTRALDDYDAFAASRRLAGFVDLLSNWYVRRARRRFWRGPLDADKRAAHATLFVALRTLSRLYAPMAPFTADALHEAVVRSALGDEAPDSVHLDDWPFAPAAWRDEALRAEMATVRAAVALGHTGRAQDKLKVRQPLARAVVVASGAAARAVTAHAPLIAEELNVKAVDVVADPGGLMELSVLPNYRTLGPRFGQRMPEVRAAVIALDPRAAADGRVAELLGEPIDPAEDLLVRVEPRPGYAVARDASAAAGAVGAVALETTLTDALVAEGRAREIVHAVQTARKATGLAVADHVAVLRLAGAPELEAAATAHADTIAAEVLADAVAIGGDDVTTDPTLIDGLELRIALSLTEA